MDHKPAVNAQNSAISSADEKYFVWMALLIAAITYIGTLRFSFAYDDLPQIVGNPFLSAWHYVPQYFVSSVWKHMFPKAPGNYYRPLFLVLLRACYAIFELRPAGWHLATLSLHLAATWLTFQTVRKMSGDFIISWLAALIFGLHPIHHEVVAWASAMTESLFAILFLAAFLAYLKSREGSKVLWMSVSCALYGLALLAKETAIVLPLLVFAYAWIEDGSTDGAENAGAIQRIRGALVSAAAFVPIAAVYLGVRTKVLLSLGHSTTHVSTGAWLITLPLVTLKYVRDWFLPYRLSEYYDVHYQTTVSFARVVLPVLILAALAVATWIAAKRLGEKLVAIAVAWVVIPLLPALATFVFGPDELVHDRYFYVPSVGAAMLVALLIVRVAQTPKALFGLPAHVLGAALALTVVLSFLGARAASFWYDDYTLFSRAHEVAPMSMTATNNLGAVLMSRQQFDRAQALFETGLRNNPLDYRFTYNLGRLYYHKNDFDKAEIYLRDTITLTGDFADAYVYLAQVELKQNQTKEAQKNLQRAVELNPYSAPYHTSYGIVLALTGDCVSATQQFQDALTLNPDDSISQMQMIRCRIELSRNPASKPGAL